MISFTARYINSLNVQRISYTDDSIRPLKVSCIELDPQNMADVDAAMALSDMWDSNEKYEDFIGLNMYASSEGELTGDIRYYALTTQEKDFNNPDPTEIIAVSQVLVKPKEARIEYLQVKPERYGMFVEPYKIKYAGSRMLDLIKNLFKGSNITLFSNPYAKKFYLKNGFKASKTDNVKMSFMA